MGKDPAFLFYPGDWLGGTLGMTFEEKGAYIELLMLQFNRGHMTSHMIGQTVGQLWDKISFKFIEDENGLYYNARLEIEIEKRKHFIQSRFNNLTGINQYTKKTGHKAGHMTSHMENENENEIKDIIELYKGTTFAKIEKLTEARKKHLQARIKEHGIEKVKEMIAIADKSDFLHGKNNNGWKANFDWLMNPNNFVKVIEGNYVNKQHKDMMP